MRIILLFYNSKRYSRFHFQNRTIRVFILHNTSFSIGEHVYICFIALISIFFKKCYSTISTKNKNFTNNESYYALHQIEANNNITCMLNIAVFSAVKNITSFIYHILTIYTRVMLIYSHSIYFSQCCIADRYNCFDVLSINREIRSM